MWIVIWPMLWQLLESIPGVDSVACFCTESHCAYGVCESRTCLVGIKITGKVVRTCGNEVANYMQSTCRLELGDWSEVCICESTYCNTFQFFRNNIQSSPQLHAMPPSSPTSPIVRHHSSKLKQYKHPQTNLIDSIAPSHSNNYQDSEPIIINRQSNDVEPPSGDGAHLVNVQKSNLIVVLIVVPLAVGAAAVVIIVANYYCKMC